ncbi:MAG: hypothetical protein JXA60_07880 [Candidatus Coatesbacteria bacterium]|nr:hypothetical protein [Candidatus Coatesbacteria bacterium]
MKKLYVAFLWHMHQPYYKNLNTNEYTMPWVRLHSCKGYYDIPSLVSHFNKTNISINLVPSLISQIKDYAKNDVKEKYLSLSQKPAAELSIEEKILILRKFFMANPQTMISKYPRYDELFKKRGATLDNINPTFILGSFTEQDFRDLQIWFNLAWFGFEFVKKDDILRELIQKGRSFSENDKSIVLAKQQQCIKELLPLYKKLLKAKKIEITGSPFYHPIIPLIINNRNALESQPFLTIPDSPFSAYEDAEKQIKMGKDAFHENFGENPHGFWPPEGGVCPEMISILSNNGYNWMAADEEILYNSSDGFRNKGDILYRPYIYENEDYGRIYIFFRDKFLSDSMGFKYARNTAETSLEDFFYHMQNIHEYTKNFDYQPIVSIMLDGENPWEAFNDGGEAFLNGLYRIIEETSFLETITFSEYLEKHSESATSLGKLYRGSWINHNFEIWIGKSEENNAWNLLSRARNFLVNYEYNHPELLESQLRKAWDALYIAEGSDWFWWYDDDFSTENDLEFDYLFRQHLKTVYTSVNALPPAELGKPICKSLHTISSQDPVGFIDPVIDGKQTNFYEWELAGYIIPSFYGPMKKLTPNILKEARFGFNKENLFFRLDFENKQVFEKNYIVDIIFLKPYKKRIIFKLIKGEHQEFSIMSPFGHDEYRLERNFPNLAIEDIVEIKTSFDSLDINPEEIISFAILIVKDGVTIERLPLDDYINFKSPSLDYGSSMWTV